MNSNILYINDLEEKIVQLQEETHGLIAYNTDQCDIKINAAVSGTAIELKCDIYEMQEKLASLEANLRSVMDAMADKPKQKWLWEIFEPNDFDIDFSYIL